MKRPAPSDRARPSARARHADARSRNGDEEQLVVIEKLVAMQQAQRADTTPELIPGDEIVTGAQSNCGTWIRYAGSARWQCNLKAQLSSKTLRATELERSRGATCWRHATWNTPRAWYLRCKCGAVFTTQTTLGDGLRNGWCGRVDCAARRVHTRPCAVCGNLGFCDGRRGICHWLGAIDQGRSLFWINPIQYKELEASWLRMSADDQRRSCPFCAQVCALLDRHGRTLSRWRCPRCSACLPVREIVLASSFCHPWVIEQCLSGVPARLIMIHLDRQTLGMFLLTQNCRNTYNKLDLAAACLAGVAGSGCVDGILRESWQESFVLCDIVITYAKPSTSLNTLCSGDSHSGLGCELWRAIPHQLTVCFFIRSIAKADDLKHVSSFFFGLRL